MSVTWYVLFPVKNEVSQGYSDENWFLVYLQKRIKSGLPCMMIWPTHGDIVDYPQWCSQSCDCEHSCDPAMVVNTSWWQCDGLFLCAPCAQEDCLKRVKGGGIVSLRHTREEVFILIFIILCFKHIAKWEVYVWFVICFHHSDIYNDVSLKLPQMVDMEVPMETYCLFRGIGDDDVVFLTCYWAIPTWGYKLFVLDGVVS